MSASASSYQGTMSRRRAFKVAYLRWLAALATGTAEASPLPVAYGLTWEQGMSVRNEIARTLDTRAENEGRLRQ